MPFSCSHSSYPLVSKNGYNMVHHKHGEKLYAGLVTTMTEELKEMSKFIAGSEKDSFLEVLNNKWNDHVEALNIILNILMYMERVSVIITQKTPIYQLGPDLWTGYVLRSRNSQIRARLTRTLNKLIIRERRVEQVIDRALVWSTIKMLIELGSSVYEDVFKKPFLEISGDFYRSESQKLLIECCDCGDYLKKAEIHLEEEIERASSYMDPKTEPMNTTVVEKEMISNQKLRLVNMEVSGFHNMLNDDKHEDLGRMYKLFRRIDNGLSKIREMMVSHVRNASMKLVTDPESAKDPIKFVQGLLDESEKYDKIISLAFNNDETFQNGFNSSFEFIINLNPSLPCFLSLFINDKLRKQSLAGVSDKVMVLLHYLQRKDLFEEYYKQHMAERLVTGETASDNAERSMIIELKTEFGSRFTYNLEDMLSSEIFWETVEEF